MDDATTRLQKQAGRIRCAFFFCLIFLIGGALPTLLNLPGLQARFTGIETTALITSDLS